MGENPFCEPREQIFATIERHPGIHFNELVRSVEFASGQVQYHVYRLLDADRVVEEPLIGRTHYYRPGYEAWDRRGLALLRRETSRAVLVTLLEEPGQQPNAVADSLDLPRSTLEYHLDQLTEQDLVEKRRERGRVTLHPTRPQDTEELLAEITPSLSDQLVDRLMRLTDDLFDER